MGWLILASFAVGVFVLLLFAPEGRWLIGKVLIVVAAIIGITLLGAAVIYGFFYVLAALPY